SSAAAAQLRGGDRIGLSSQVRPARGAGGSRRRTDAPGAGGAVRCGDAGHHRPDPAGPPGRLHRLSDGAAVPPRDRAAAVGDLPIPDRAAARGGAGDDPDRSLGAPEMHMKSPVSLVSLLAAAMLYAEPASAQ